LEREQREEENTADGEDDLLLLYLGLLISRE